ncbi:MAG TPA: Uma2 family endonuclease [Pyrinomonadaceae bacterium]|nr:Uma2 family endonuclease [Pyrinomonadaceae bacterium]
MTTEVINEEAEEQSVRYKATIEEFWALPESVLPVEYINGEIIMAPTPTVLHQTVLRNLFRMLDEFVLRTKIGSVLLSPLDVVLPSGDVVQPDAFFLTNEETSRANEANRVQGAPSFLVEVLSPGSVKHDARTKRGLYERNGVREYWIVDPRARTVAQLVRRGEHFELTELGEGDTIRGVVLGGFETTVGALVNDR